MGDSLFIKRTIKIITKEDFFTYKDFKSIDYEEDFISIEAGTTIYIFPNNSITAIRITEDE